VPGSNSLPQLVQADSSVTGFAFSCVSSSDSANDCNFLAPAIISINVLLFMHASLHAQRKKTMEILRLHSISKIVGDFVTIFVDRVVAMNSGHR
jgi:hypothetical protein